MFKTITHAMGLKITPVASVCALMVFAIVLTPIVGYFISLMP